MGFKKLCVFLQLFLASLFEIIQGEKVCLRHQIFHSCDIFSGFGTKFSAPHKVENFIEQIWVAINKQRLRLDRKRKLCQSNGDDQQQQSDWLVEMKSKSYESIRENKEDLFDHEDWIKYRSPSRRVEEAFDAMFPLLVVFVAWFLWVAVQL